MGPLTGHRTNGTEVRSGPYRAQTAPGKPKQPPPLGR
jgi:hypothetical protein